MLDFLFAAQEIGDVNLVLDCHDAVEIPERGLRRRITESGGIFGIHAQQARDVILRIGEIFVADQIVNALGEQRLVSRIEGQFFERMRYQLPVLPGELFAFGAGAFQSRRFIRDPHPADRELSAAATGAGSRFIASWAILRPHLNASQFSVAALPMVSWMPYSRLSRESGNSPR